jgi:hypothetical protein
MAYGRRLSIISYIIVEAKLLLTPLSTVRLLTSQCANRSILVNSDHTVSELCLHTESFGKRRLWRPLTDQQGGRHVLSLVSERALVLSRWC